MIVMLLKPEFHHYSGRQPLHPHTTYKSTIRPFTAFLRLRLFLRLPLPVGLQGLAHDVLGLHRDQQRHLQHELVAEQDFEFVEGDCGSGGEELVGALEEGVLLEGKCGRGQSQQRLHQPVEVLEGHAAGVVLEGAEDGADPLLESTLGADAEAADQFPTLGEQYLKTSRCRPCDK
jgi:hypothetical protein